MFFKVSSAFLTIICLFIIARADQIDSVQQLNINKSNPIINYTPSINYDADLLTNSTRFSKDTSIFREKTNFERYQANKKPFWMALFIQVIGPGFGNFYLDGNIVKPIVYPATIIVSEIGAVWLSNQLDNDPFLYTGIGIATAMWIYSIIDIFPSYKKYDNNQRIKYNISLSPKSIILSYDF